MQGFQKEEPAHLQVEIQTVSNRCQMEQFWLKFSFKRGTVSQQIVPWIFVIQAIIFLHIIISCYWKTEWKGVSSVSMKIISFSAKPQTAEKDSEIFAFSLTGVLNLRELLNFYAKRSRICSTYCVYSQMKMPLRGFSSYWQTGFSSTFFISLELKPFLHRIYKVCKGIFGIPSGT